MIRVLSVVVIYFSFFHVSFAQKMNDYEFIGALTTANHDIISYKIKFKQLDDGKIEGVSYTDFYGEDNTESKIVGTLDLKKDLLSFKEVKNITSKSDEDQSIFCYVNVDNVKIRTVRGKRIIQGSFIGLYSNKEKCAEGSIYLAGKELLEALNITNDSIRKIDSLMKENGLNKEVKFLKKNDKINFSITEDKIVFDVWDGYKEDGDVIDIYFNDELIEKDFVIKNDKKTFKIPFQGNKAIVKIVAVNEGETKPNSVNFMFKNNDEYTPVVSNLKTGEEVTIIFNR